MKTPPDGAVCNIAGRGRVRRAVLGVVALAGAAAAMFVLDRQFETHWWRLGLVPVLGFAFLCLFQAQEST